MASRVLSQRDVLTSLAIGSAVTVLVSWSLALHADSRTRCRTEGAPWPARAPDDWPPAAKWVSDYSARWGFGGLQQSSAWGNDDGSHRGDCQMFVTRSGWPFLAMQSRLVKKVTGEFWSADDGPYDNDRTIGA